MYAAGLHQDGRILLPIKSNFWTNDVSMAMNSTMHATDPVTNDAGSETQASGRTDDDTEGRCSSATLEERYPSSLCALSS